MRVRSSASIAAEATAETPAEAVLDPSPVNVGTTLRQFPLDYAPLHMSLPVERGFAHAMVRQVNGEDFLTLYAEGLPSGEASISMPLDHATEFAARLNKLLESAEIAGLSTN